MNQTVLVITGPPGAGKTTIAKMVASRYGFKYVSGDEIKKRLFPEIKNITDYPSKLKQVKSELLAQTKESFDSGKSVVVDYVVLGEDYIKQYQELFADDLLVRILLPHPEVITNRDRQRSCWTAGEKSIVDLHTEFTALESLLDENSFVDNTDETPEQTIGRHFSHEILVG